MLSPAILTASELQEVLDSAFPETQQIVVQVTELGVISHLPIDLRHQRPGGTISGPTLMGLADSTAWLSVMSRIGPVVLAVTTSLHIDFLRQPALSDIVATGEILKLGSRLGVVEVTIRSATLVDVVAKAQVTYSIPPSSLRRPT